MMRILPAILFAAALLLCGHTAAHAAPPEGISIQVETGYNGWVQLSRVNPVIVEMENNSASTNLSGELVLEYNGVEYVTRLDLPTPSRKRFYLYFPCDSYPPMLLLRVRTKEYTEQFELSTSYRTFPATDHSVVVLTRQSGSLGMLNGRPGARLYRDLFASQTMELGASTVHVAYYDLDQAEANPKFFARADAVVLADIDYQQVSAEMAEALKACAAGGTSVVFSLGLNGAEIAGSELAELCPLDVGGTVQTAELGSFGQRYGIEPGALATLATGDVRPGAEVRSWAGTVPAIVRQGWGSGHSVALAFDVTAVPFKQNPALAPIFADHVLTLANSVAVSNWFIHPEAVSDVLMRLSEAKPMSPGFVLLFLAAYIVLIGPLNFLILSKLKRRTLVWVTIPLLIAGFAYLGLSTGYIYRGSDNVCAYFQELHVYPQARYTPYQTTMLVFTAERSNYTLEVPDRSAFIYPDIPAVLEGWQFGAGGRGMRGLQSGQIDNSGQPSIDATQGKWTQKSYFYTGFIGQSGNLSSTLSVERDQGSSQASGGFTLDLPYSLFDCRLVVPGGTYYFDELAGQGSYSIAGDAVGSNSEPGGQGGGYLLASRGELASAFAKSATLGLEYRDEALLIGFTRDIQNLAEFKRPHVNYQLSMVVVHLPYTKVVPQDGRPRLAGWRLLGGQGFELQERYWEETYRPEDRRYIFEQGGYLDAAYQIAGNVSGNAALTLLPQAWTNAQDEQPLESLSQMMGLEIRTGDGWVPLQVPAQGLTLYAPIAGRLDNEHEVVIRYRALAPFMFELPRPTI